MTGIDVELTAAQLAALEAGQPIEIDIIPPQPAPSRGGVFWYPEPVAAASPAPASSDSST